MVNNSDINTLAQELRIKATKTLSLKHYYPQEKDEWFAVECPASEMLSVLDALEAAQERIAELEARESWKLVPIVPTPDMIAAAMESDDVSFDEIIGECTISVHHDNIYAAMVGAAPALREGE
ncbi:hypothetical protein [Pragia fontium]|uniref:hypothetical protein n=1 Tax=Pragia fontium TaxID=82985 RepID=UPI0006499BAC|nr:hypothetical protein [Pragia fontium]AKJ41761.1 hypothetical protein QQ39_06410 [Pragia fontium]